MFPKIQGIYDFKGCKTNFKVLILPSDNEMYPSICIVCSVLVKGRAVRLIRLNYCARRN